MCGCFFFLARLLKPSLHKKNQSFSFELLPLEIQETIFSLLPISTLIVCTAVSRSFRSTIVSHRFTSSYTRSQPLFLFFLNDLIHSTYDPDLDRSFSLPLPQFSVRKRYLSDSLCSVEHHHAHFSIGPYLHPKTTYGAKHYFPGAKHYFPAANCLDDDSLFYLSVDGQLVKSDITSGNQEYLTKTLPISSDVHFLFGVDKRLFLVGGNCCRYLFLNDIRIWEFDFLRKEWNLHCSMPWGMFPDLREGVIAQIVGNKGMICFVHNDNSILMYDVLRKKWWRPKSFGRGKVHGRVYCYCLTMKPSIILG